MAVHDGAAFLTGLNSEFFLDVPESSSALINIIGNYHGTIEVTGSTLLSDVATVWGARNVSPNYSTNLIVNDGSDIVQEYRIATGGQSIRLKMIAYVSGVAGVRVTATISPIVVETKLPTGAATEETLVSISNSFTPKDTLLDVSGAYTYIGKAAPGSATSDAVWQISRLDETTEDIQLKYADGVGSYSKIWNDRVSYSY